MGISDEMVELVKQIDVVRRKTKEEAVVNLCDRMLRWTQRVSMTDRGVEILEQEKVLQPLPKEK